MRRARVVLFLCLAMTVVACSEKLTTNESLIFHFEAPEEENGGFACYPSAFQGWLCESGTESGRKIRALHIQPDVDSMLDMFELVRDAAHRVATAESVAKREEAVAELKREIGRSARGPTCTLKVEYAAGSRREVVRITGTSMKISEVLEIHPPVTTLYRQTINPLGLGKGCWFRGLSPTPQDMENWEYLPFLDSGARRGEDGEEGLPR